MMMCDRNDDATGDGRVASNGATDDAGDVDAISGERTLLRFFFDAGTEVGAGNGVGVGVDVGVALDEALAAETGDNA